MWTRVSTIICVTLAVALPAQASIWVDNPSLTTIATDPIVDVTSAETALDRIVWFNCDKIEIGVFDPSPPQAVDLLAGFTLPEHADACYAELFFALPVQIAANTSSNWFTSSSESGGVSVRLADDQVLPVETLVTHEAFGWRVQRPE